MKIPTYGLIGRGRVATHMAHYLSLEDRIVIPWHRGLGSDPESALREAAVILVAISDDALAPFLRDHPELGDRPVVHFSGSRVLEVAHGLHPLMTFGPELYDLATYRSIPFVAERGETEFADVFPGLCNPNRTIDPALKPLYHALCVLAGNFTTILWSKAMDDFEHRLKLPGDILRPFLEQTAANSLDHGRNALTGSLARNDGGTIARDLEGLADDPFREVYLAFARAVTTMEVAS